MFAEVPAAAVAAVMAMLLCYATADGLMGKASLASPHVQHPHELAQGLQESCSLYIIAFGNVNVIVTRHSQQD